MNRRRRVTLVVHATRPELGTGEIGELVAGKPPVLQVYWPEPEKYGYYLSTDLRRIRQDGTIEAVESATEPASG